MKRHIRFSDEDNFLVLLDQRYLPEERWFTCRNVEDIVYAIKKMVVRGAPAIGIVAGYGCYLAAATTDGSDPNWQSILKEKLEYIAFSRPTAVNLVYVIDKMEKAWRLDPDVTLEDLKWIWLKMAKEIHKEDVVANQAMGRFGQELIPEKATIMTHCNAGALATGGYGTALGVIRAAKSAGKNISVIANETRPFLQGARITAYELYYDDIPVKVVCDNSSAFLMAKGMVDVVIVGADRIAANGDTANKIGTYNLAVLCNYHNIPFYVAAPSSTFDLNITSGSEIPIEERPGKEVTHIGEKRIVLEGVEVYNFAFDVTPNELITAIITEKGIIKPPFALNIEKIIAPELKK